MTNKDYIKNKNYKKIKDFLNDDIVKINKPNILEFGVQKGYSTFYFLNSCKNRGKLTSVDIKDCSKLFKNKNWTFIKSRDDDYKLISEYIGNKLDIIYLDTMHTADHVEKIINLYFSKLKINGYFVIDDTFWLPYCKNQYRDNFWIEINNRETFKRILEIYNNNQKTMELKFSYNLSGMCKIKKINDNKLNNKKKIINRELSIRNIIRKSIIFLRKTY
jgi:predicted O-methyltransferase YrrM